MDKCRISIIYGVYEMRADLIHVDETYRVQMNNTQRHGFAKVLSIKKTLIGSPRFQVEILDSIFPTARKEYTLASHRIMQKMSEEEWKEYKEIKINLKVEKIINPIPEKRWTGATIRSFREYMK